MNITSQDNSILITRPEICDFDITVNLTEAVSTASNNLLVTDSTGLFVGLLGTGLVRSVAGVISYINGTSAQFVKANGTLDSNTYLTSEVDTLQSVTSRGATTTTSLTALSFIKTGGSVSQFLKADGSVDNNTYLTANQLITLSGDISGSGTTSIVTSIGAGKVTNTMLVNSAVTIIAGTGLSGGGTVSLGGTITLNNTITQYTDALARAAISLTTTGASGASTYNNTTGVFNIPTYTASGLGAVPTTRTLTINGTTQDLSANRTWSVGTVTSVGATAGTGISISGSPITTSGSITITNTAPDQTVVLSNGSGINVTGTYPNFTITSTITQYTDALARAALSAGTGISYNSSTGVITNSAPDQTVALTAGTNISITGSYPNFTINATGSGSVTSVNLTAGTGISVSGGPITTSGSITVNNTAPDQTVSLTNGGNITITGTYPNFTLTNGVTNNNQLTNGNGYITGYTETDTLATVTARGASTSIQSTFNGGLSVFNPAGGYTGEGICVGRSLKVDGSAGGQTTAFYMVPNVLSNSYGVGATIQIADISSTYGYGLSLNASGSFEMWNFRSGNWYKSINVDINNIATFTDRVTANRFVGNNAVGNVVDTIQSGGGSILGNLYRAEHKFQTTSTTIDASATGWHDNGSGSPTYTLPNSGDLSGGFFLFVKEGSGTLTLSGTIINTLGASVGSVSLTSASGMKMFSYNGASWYQLN